MAVWCGCTDAVRYSLGHDKALINCLNSSNRLTPLHYAAGNNKKELGKFLLMHPGISVNLKNNINELPDEFCKNVGIKNMIREHRRKFPK